MEIEKHEHGVPVLEGARQYDCTTFTTYLLIKIFFIILGWFEETVFTGLEQIKSVPVNFSCENLFEIQVD